MTQVAMVTRGPSDMIRRYGSPRKVCGFYPTADVDALAKPVEEIPERVVRQVPRPSLSQPIPEFFTRSTLESTHDSLPRCDSRTATCGILSVSKNNCDRKARELLARVLQESREIKAKVFQTLTFLKEESRGRFVKIGAPTVQPALELVLTRSGAFSPVTPSMDFSKRLHPCAPRPLRMCRTRGHIPASHRRGPGCSKIVPSRGSLRSARGSTSHSYREDC